jgi:hypothetical protein
MTVANWLNRRNVRDCIEGLRIEGLRIEGLRHVLPACAIERPS